MKANCIFSICFFLCHNNRKETCDYVCIYTFYFRFQTLYSYYDATDFSFFFRKFHLVVSLSLDKNRMKLVEISVWLKHLMAVSLNSMCGIKFLQQEKFTTFHVIDVLVYWEINLHGLTFYRPK